MSDELDLELDGQQDDGGSDAPPASQPKKEEAPVDWQAKFNGMKGTALKEKRRAEKLAAEKQAIEQKYAELEIEVVSTKTTLGQELETYKGKATQNETEAAKLRKQLELGKTIRKDYPVLVDLFDEGLLAVDGREGDDLTDYLTKMASKVAGLADQQVRDKAKGSTPPPPPSGERQNPAMSVQEAKANVSKVLAEKGIHSPEYRAAMETYRQALIGAHQT